MVSQIYYAAVDKQQPWHNNIKHPIPTTTTPSYRKERAHSRGAIILMHVGVQFTRQCLKKKSLQKVIPYTYIHTHDFPARSFYMLTKILNFCVLFFLRPLFLQPRCPVFGYRSGRAALLGRVFRGLHFRRGSAAPPQPRFDRHEHQRGPC